MSTTAPALGQAPQDVQAAFAALNDKRRKMVVAMGKGMSQEQAALEAGYSASTAKARASEMANDPRMQVVLAYLTASEIQRAGLELAPLMAQLKAIALSDPRRLYDADGLMLPPHQWPDDVAMAVAGIEADEIAQQVDGKTVHMGYTRKVKLWGKLDAIEKALKLLAAYPEKKEIAPVTPIVGVVVVPAKTPWQDRHKPAIDVESRRIERTAPLPPKATEFKVAKV